MATVLNPAAMDGSLLDMAFQYGLMGWRLLPVDGKKPRIKDWPKSASPNSIDIRRWFRSGCNIGVATGQASEIVVIDVDPRNGGDEYLISLEDELGPLPTTVKAISGGGGWHLVFKWFVGAKSKSAGGVDFLADGKMFVVAPSMHPDTSAIYEWAVNPFLNAPAQLPESWQKYLSGRSSNLAGEVSPILLGRRNDYLASVAGQLKAAGHSQRSIQNKLAECNALECKPQLPDQEVLAIAASISRYEATGKSIKTQWQEAVFHSDLHGTTKLILQALSMFADQNGKSCWPTQEQIAAMANCSSRTVRNRLAEAASEGWVFRYTQPRKGTQGFNYGYVLQLKERN